MQNLLHNHLNDFNNPAVRHDNRTKHAIRCSGLKKQKVLIVVAGGNVVQVMGNSNIEVTIFDEDNQKASGINSIERERKLANLYKEHPVEIA